NQIVPVPDSPLVLATRSLNKDVETFRISFVIDSRTGRSLRTWQDQAIAHNPIGLSGGRLLTFDGTKIVALDVRKGQRAAVSNAATGEQQLERHSIEFGDPVFNISAWDLAEDHGRVLYPAHHPDRHDRKALVVWDLLTGKEVA